VTREHIWSHSSLSCGPKCIYLKSSKNLTCLQCFNWGQPWLTVMKKVVRFRFHLQIKLVIKIWFYQTSWWRWNYHRERFGKLTVLLLTLPHSFHVSLSHRRSTKVSLETRNLSVIISWFGFQPEAKSHSEMGFNTECSHWKARQQHLWDYF